MSQKLRSSKTISQLSFSMTPCIDLAGNSHHTEVADCFPYLGLADVLLFLINSTTSFTSSSNAIFRSYINDTANKKLQTTRKVEQQKVIKS